MHGLLLSLVWLASWGLGRESSNDPVHPELGMSFFPPLRNLQVNLSRVEENRYPWIARLVHSTRDSFPHVCTATCIAPRIFVTAGRCILRLRVSYTRVWYKSEFILVRAFVVHTQLTKQAYDDLGLVVTQPFAPADGQWAALAPFTERNRTDGRFDWLRDMRTEDNREDYYVVAYASKTLLSSYKDPCHLYAMNVVVSTQLCNKLTRWDEHTPDYHVPCYHSCDVTEQKQQLASCHSYLGAEGGALVDVKTNVLLGVATWGAYTEALKRHLPVGFAIPNSVVFYKDYRCALKIRDNAEVEHGDLYQSVCDEN